MTASDLRSVLSATDKGDDVQRRFRYQHACGVQLLLRMLVMDPRPVCLWCEHHEDFLVEHRQGQFHAYQVKTRLEDEGRWRMTDVAFTSSIRRFVHLESKYPGTVSDFTFLSNVRGFDTSDEKEIKRSPIKCIQTVKAATSLQHLAEPFRTAVVTLAEAIECLDSDVFAVLKKTDFMMGPPLDGFEAVVAHTSVGKHPSCQNASPAKLNELRDELIQVVAKASALTYEGSDSDWVSLLAENETDPRLKGKQVLPSYIEQILSEKQPFPFRFAPIKSTILSTKESTSVLEQKLVRGGLADQVETMQRRKLSAEMHLIGIAERAPERSEAMLDQLDSVVRGICDDERQAAVLENPDNFGQKMYSGVVRELRRKSREEADLIYEQTEECLIGIAGLLTEECKVWWSPVFPLVGQS
ncbi:CD-NTase associated protein 4, DNA endonuclease domain containing protein [Fimbriimonadaceae bacterium]